MESINLESIMNGGGGYIGLNSSINGGPPSSSSSGLGSGGLLSSATSTDSLSLDDLPNSFHHMNHNHHNHLTNDPNLHHLSVSNHFTPSTNISSTSTSNNNNNNTFSLDQFDVDPSSCQLLQSYNLKDDDDYGLLDDDDLVGSFMSGGLHQDAIGQSISDHLTPAQFNLLEDCLDHITSSDALVSAAPTSSITTIPVSTALNHINHHNNHLNTNHIGSHQNDFSTINHSHYDASSIIGGFSDCGELSDELNEHLGVSTTGNGSMVTSSQPLIQAAVSSNNNHVQHGHMVSTANVTVVATTSNGYVVQPLCSQISVNSSNLLSAPIITTSNNNCATVVMPANTTTSLSPNLNSNTPNLTLVKLQEPPTSTMSTLKSPQVVPSSLSVTTATPIATLVTPTSCGQPAILTAKSAASKTPQPKAKPANSGKTESSSKAAPSATSGNNNNSNNAQGANQAYPDEISRLTICPLCDISKSFCSSSSVTRHLRSVHKLSDIPGTRNCYCLLCSRFLEDIPEFFNHLEKDHHVSSHHKPPKPLNSLYNKHQFKTFEEFLEWKTNTFEVEAGYKYERCFTNEYSRSIYFKCGAIRINRITMSGFKHSASTSSKPIVAIDSGSKNSLVVSNVPVGGAQEGEEKKAETNIIQDDMIIDSSYDNRMYPCTSTIRVLYRYSGLEVIVFPYHLGHKVVPEKKDILLTSSTSNINYLTNSSQVSGDTITTSTINPNTNQQIKTEVRLPFAVNVNKISTGSCTTNPTIAMLPKINTLVTTNATVTTPQNIANNNLSTNVNNNNNNGHTCINNNNNNNCKVNNNNANSKANRKRAREQQSTQTVTPKLEQQSTSNTICSNVATLTPKNTNKSIKLQHGSGTKTSVATTTGIVSAFSLTPTLGQLLSTSSAYSSTSHSSIAATTGIPKIELLDTSTKLIKSQPVDTVKSDIFVESPSYHFDHHNQSIDRKGSNEMIRVKSEISTTPHGHTDPTLAAGLIKSYPQSMGIKTEDFSDSKDSAIVVSTTNTTAIHGDAAADDKSFIHSGSNLNNNNNNTNNDGLVIVPIEREMQILQESLRPRKEQLRKRFNELLDTCLTESDIELVEHTVEQLISNTLLQ